MQHASDELINHRLQSLKIDSNDISTVFSLKEVAPCFIHSIQTSYTPMCSFLHIKHYDHYIFWPFLRFSKMFHSNFLAALRLFLCVSQTHTHTLLEGNFRSSFTLIATNSPSTHPGLDHMHHVKLSTFTPTWTASEDDE